MNWVFNNEHSTTTDKYPAVQSPTCMLHAVVVSVLPTLGDVCIYKTVKFPDYV